MEQTYCVYLIHNVKNNKVYVGKAGDSKARWRKHLSIASCKRAKEQFAIHRAIHKYGESSFEFTVIQSLPNELICNEAEQYWISFFKSKSKQFGYNLTEGGEGVSGRVVSEETREKIRQKALGRKHTQETKLKMSGDGNHHSKLTSNEVKNIRNVFNKNTSLVSLAKEYKISSAAIARVIYNVDWYDKNYIPPLPRFTTSNGKPKLTQELVNEIRDKYNEGFSSIKIAKMFDVTKTNVLHIVHFRTWK